MISCSLHLLAAHVQEKPLRELADAHKTCLNVEQGLVVSAEEYEAYVDTFVDAIPDERVTESLLIDIIKNLGVHSGFAQLVIASAESSSLLQGPSATNVIEVFQRGGTYSTIGGDVFFVGPWDSPVENEVCDLPPRGGLIGGVFA